MKFYVVVLISCLVACGGGENENNSKQEGLESPLPKLEKSLFIGGSSSDDKPDTIRLDSSGNIIVQGDTTGSADGQPFIGGREDYYLIKYDSAGEKLWTKQLGSTEDDIAGGMVIDSEDNIIAVGSTAGIISATVNNGGYDCFIQKFDADGGVLWTKLFGTTQDEICDDVDLDDEDNIYIIGVSSGDLDGQENNGNIDSFISKFDKDGNKVWIEMLGCGGFDYFSGLDVNASTGFVYVTGESENNLNDCSPVNGFSDVVTVAFDLNGNRQWLRMFDGTGETGTDWGWTIISAESGYSFITGQVADGVSADQSFVISYDSNGNLRWSKIYQDPGYDFGQAIVLDGNDNILVAIVAEGQISDVANTLGDDSAYIVRFDQNGNELDVYYHNYGVITKPRSLAIDDENDIYMYSRLDNGSDKDSVISRFDENGVLQGD